MAVVFTDKQIAMLIRERKSLPQDLTQRVQLRPKRGHKERDLVITGVLGHEFRLILRQSSLNLLNFSVILAVRAPTSNLWFRLRRYNGKSHRHTNHIEGTIFYNYHIHMATERYQAIASREDAYAEVSARYSDLAGAFNCMLEDGNFDVPPGAQMILL